MTRSGVRSGASRKHGTSITASMKRPAAFDLSNLHFLVRALRYRNYRLFFSGQSISLIGTWMTRVATSWLVYRLTGSAWLLGIVGFAGQFPTFLLAPFAGVWIDRMDRHKILVVTQVLAMIQSFALALLTLGNWITVWEIVAVRPICLRHRTRLKRRKIRKALTKPSVRLRRCAIPTRSSST